MKVWVIYEKDGYGGSQVEKIYSNEESAIMDQMDKLSYLKRLTEDQLREIAKPHVHEHDVIDKY